MKPDAVAVILESFSIGGREKVIHAMARVLNELGIVPDVYTVDPPASREVLQDAFGADAAYELRRMPNFLPEAISGLRAPYANFMALRLQRRYAWFLNLTGSLALCGTRCPVFHYVNIPERYIVLHHNADAAPGGLKRMRRRLHERLVEWLDVPKPGHYFACNSRSIRELFVQCHPGTDPVVLHPPIEVGRFSPQQARKRQILNVGRYGIAKGQLQLIGLAGLLKDFRIVCVGPGEGNEYYRACADAVRSNGFSNVELLGAVGAPRLRELMEESMFYVHLFKNEPFGMATAEAIAAGCMPIVPDSWGNREIVCVPELRINDEAGIVERIRVLEGSPEKREHYGRLLREHVSGYDIAEFRRGFLDWIQPVVNRLPGPARREGVHRRDVHVDGPHAPSGGGRPEPDPVAVESPSVPSSAAR